MDAKLWLFVALGMGLITAVGAFLAATKPPSGAKGLWTTSTARAALLLPFLGFLLTLPAKPPLFAAGHGLGLGVLIGGIASLLYAFIAARRGSTARDADVGGAVFALPVVAATLPLLFLRPVLLDALFGVALGWMGVALLLYVTDPEATDTADLRPALALGAGSAAAIATAVALGTLRDERTPELPHALWSALAVTLAAGGGLLHLILGMLRRPASDTGAGAGRVVSPVIAVAVLGLLAALGATRVVHEIRFLAVFVAGLLLWPVVAWVNRAGSASTATSPLPGAAWPILLLAGGFMLSGQLLQGYGTAIWLLGAILSASVLWPAIRPTDGEKASLLETGELRLLLFATGLVLFRAEQARWGADLRSAAPLADHYALFGLLVGVLTPALAAGTSSFRAPLLRAGTLGLLICALPAAIVVLFGVKCVPMMLIGVALGSLLGEGLLPALAAVAVGLVVDQVLGRLLPLSEWTRPDRIKALVLLVGLTIAALAVRRSAPPSPGEAKEGGLGVEGFRQ